MAKTVLPHLERSDSGEIVLTNRELVYSYMRYSEDIDEVPYSPKKTFAELVSSSPTSTASNHDGDTSYVSAVSQSTTQTTPLRNELLAMANRRIPTTPFEEFEAVLYQAELPSSLIAEYREQARNIMGIAEYLSFQSQRVSRIENKQQTTDLITVTKDWVATALHDAEDQVRNVAYIQRLGPFTIKPKPDALWPVYKQMTELVLTHTRRPSQEIVNVIEALATVYDAYVYQPALAHRTIHDTDDDIEPQLHDLYHAIMSLLMKYQEWCRSTKELIKKHMRPALVGLLSTEDATDTTINEEAARAMADEVLGDSANPGYLPVSAEALRVLKEKRSIELLQIRAKRRFARVKTV